LRKEKLLRGEPIPDKLEVDIIHKDGTIRHLQIFRKEICWDGKQHDQLIYNDVTEREQTEEDLKASELNFRNSLDNSPMGIRISDTDNNTLHANQAFMEMFDYENIEEVRTSPPQEHFTPDSYATHLNRKERFLLDGSLLNIVEIDILHKDGTIRHLQAFNGEVLWDGKERYQTIYNDITERKRLEDETKYLASFPEINPNPIMELDFDANLKYENPATKSVLPDLSTGGANHPFLPIGRR